MGLGVLEVKPDKLVAGTIPLRQDAVASESITRVLKRGSGASATIVLAPQPSEDPNDPLNWSYRRKFLIVAIIALGAVLHVSAAVSTAILRRHHPSFRGRMWSIGLSYLIREPSLRLALSKSP